jgi:hypothetical protein
MEPKTFRRAAALALVCLLIGATAVFADTVPADGDSVTAGNQNFVYLGEHAPGAIVTANVNFALTCASLAHADEGQTITVTASSVSVPLNGTASATPTTIGPVPASWTDDGFGCPSPAPTLPANGHSVATLRMPTTPGVGYIFTVMYARVGANGLTGITAISFEVDVIANTPPVQSLPGPITAEAASSGGTAVSFAASATDAEDNPDPTPVCTPASGSVFPLGTTTVACSVTDAGGLSASGSFTVSIADTTAPALVLPADVTAEATGPGGASVDFATSASDAVDGAVGVTCDHASGDTFALGTTTVTCSAVDAAGNPTSGTFDVSVSDTSAPTLNDVPANISVTTGNPAGATVSYTMPTASDAGDPNPSVGCDPAPGSLFPVGPTTVTCTAIDAAGHKTSATFVVTVTHVSDVRWSALWGTPVEGAPSVFVTNQSRTVPIKVRIFANGVEQMSGSADLRVVTCGGDTSLVVPLAWGSGRWNAHLDMSLLNPGCYNVMATHGGTDAGSFALDVRGPEAAKTPAAVTTTPTTGKDKDKAPKK